jgi:hypothetical protein
VTPSGLLLRDGELVLYRRNRSLLDQCRFKFANGKLHHFSNCKVTLENAIATGRTRHDEAKYRQRLSTHNTHVSIVSRHQSGRNKPANFEWLFEVADAGHGLAK